MAALYLRRNLSEPGLPLSLVLSGVPVEDETPSVIAELYWRYEDDPAMKPEPLGRTVAGNDLIVPFDLKGRDIRVFINSKTDTGETAFRRMEDTPSKVFYVPSVPVLAAAEFDAGTDEVTLTIETNGGGGDISILRQIGSEGFFEIDTVVAGTPTYVDTPAIDGTYQYKLTQAGLTGESNTREVAVDVDASGAGSPPTDLSGTFDDVDTVTLNWTNNGGTGLNVIERQTSFSGSYIVAGSVSSGTSTYDDTVFPTPSGQVYFYRVRNESVSGYSNVIDVYIPKQT